MIEVGGKNLIRDCLMSVVKSQSLNHAEPTSAQKGKNEYLQGQTWEDGCSYKCRCDDSSHGIYTCNQRCPTVTSVTPGCTMKTDPRDSCCLVEVCPQPTPAPSQTKPVPTIQPIPFTGKVNLPTPSSVPGQPAPSPKPVGTRSLDIFLGPLGTESRQWQTLGC
uniref:Uncharacterized protein n=1 Tax=Magallana gigas TaxID=29159 RepID=K1RM88_MAGGI